MKSGGGIGGRRIGSPAECRAYRRAGCDGSVVRKRCGGRHVLNREVNRIIIGPAVLIKNSSPQRLWPVVGEGEIGAVGGPRRRIVRRQPSLSRGEAVMQRCCVN